MYSSTTKAVNPQSLTMKQKPAQSPILYRANIEFLINTDCQREFNKLLSRIPQGNYPLMLDNINSNFKVEKVISIATNINSRT